MNCVECRGWCQPSPWHLTELASHRWHPLSWQLGAACCKRLEHPAVADCFGPVLGMVLALQGGLLCCCSPADICTVSLLLAGACCMQMAGAVECSASLGCPLLARNGWHAACSLICFQRVHVSEHIASHGPCNSVTDRLATTVRHGGAKLGSSCGSGCTCAVQQVGGLLVSAWRPMIAHTSIQAE